MFTNGASQTLVKKYILPGNDSSGPVEVITTVALGYCPSFYDLVKEYQVSKSG